MTGYTSKALKIINAKRKKALDNSEKLYENIIASSPVLSDIDSEITGLSKRLILSFTSPENTEKIQEKLSLLKKRLDEAFEKEGINKNSFLPKFECEKCCDKGFVSGKKCECLMKLEKQLAVEELGESIPLENSRFDNFEMKLYPEENRKNMQSVYDFCENYADTFSKKSESIIMSGKTGLGKTHLSLAIANCAIEKGFTVAYGSAQNFLSKIENEHFSKADTQNDAMASLLECDLLVFDDLGTEFFSSFVASTLYSLINTRLLASRPTIINTNLSIEELKEKYGDRIASRILGNYEILYFEGKDIRILKKIASLSK